MKTYDGCTCAYTLFDLLCRFWGSLGFGLFDLPVM